MTEAPPWSSVFLHRVDQAALTQIKDSEGEIAWSEGSLPDALRESFDLRVCPYAGSRQRHPLPMNVTALRHVTAHWTDIVGTVAYLRDHYLAIRGRSYVSWSDAHRISCLALTTAAHLVEPLGRTLADGVIPGFVSTLARAFLDIENTFMLLATRVALEGGAQALDAPVEIDEVLRYVEESGTLVTRRGVCAGPPHMIREAIDAVIAPSKERAAAPGRFAALRLDLEALTAHARGFASTHLALDIFSAEAQRIACRLADALDATAPPLPRGAEIALPLRRVARRTGNGSLIRALAPGDGAAIIRAAVTSARHDRPELAGLLEEMTVHDEERSRSDASRLAAMLRQREKDIPALAYRTRCFSDAQLDAIALGLVDYLVAERGFCRALTTLGSTLAQTLGRPVPTRPLDAPEIDRMVGETPRRLLAPFVGIEIDVGTDHTVCRVGTARTPTIPAADAALLTIG